MEGTLDAALGMLRNPEGVSMGKGKRFGESQLRMGTKEHDPGSDTNRKLLHAWQTAYYVTRQYSLIYPTLLPKQSASCTIFLKLVR